MRLIVVQLPIVREITARRLIEFMMRLNMLYGTRPRSHYDVEEGFFITIVARDDQDETGVDAAARLIGFQFTPEFV